MVATRTKSYSELASQIDAVEKIGKWIAMSRMFGCQNEEQGCVIATDCFITGMPLLEYQSRNSIVMGRPSIPYDAMLAAFHERGGKSKIRSKTSELAAIELSIDGDTQEFSLSWQDAQLEPLPYIGKEDEIVATLARGEKPPLKAKYATPRSRAIMLFARVVADGIRSMSPEVNFGHYTPEEIEDFADDGNGQKPKPQQVSDTSKSVVQPARATQSIQESQAQTAAAPPPVDQQVDNNPTNGKLVESLNDPFTDRQRKEALEIMGQLKQAGMVDIVDRVKSVLAKHGLKTLADLTIGEGEALLRSLRMKEIESWASMAIKGHAQASPT